MKKKIIALVMALLMVLCMFPSVSLAGSYTISESGAYTMSALGYASGDRISIAEGLTVTLIGDSTITYTDFAINCGGGVTLTLSNVNIDDSGNDGLASLRFSGNGNTLTLADGTVSTLKGGKGFPGVDVGSGTQLTITGNGTLNAVGQGIYDDYTHTYMGAAGIGGGTDNSTGSITINSGTINATGGEYGAGIGGGYDGGAAVTITGGTVNATGGMYGAGIGGGYFGDAAVTITGGTVNATGGSRSPGIGGGGSGDGTVTISGGTITATGGTIAAAIGGGDRGGGNVKISNGTVTAIGGGNGAGIGGKTYATVEISGGVVIAEGGNHAAGIGTSYSGETFAIVITGGTVKAAGAYLGAGIGKGDKGGSGTIDISGGTVFAGYISQTGKDIDSGTDGSDGTVNISGSAAVFLQHDSITPPNADSHDHYSYDAGTAAVYGINMPSAWTDAFGAYLRVCTLSYDANGGSGAPSGVSQLYGTTASVAPDTGMSNGGYHFRGWNTQAGGTGDAYDANDTFTLTGTDTLFAQWGGTNVTVAANNDSYGGVSGGGEYEPGANVTVTATANSGYFFAGWHEGDTLVSSRASYTFTAGDDVSLTAEFGTGVILITGSLPEGMKGNAYSFTASAESGTTPYQWSAEGLPDGLSIGEDTGQITGTPTKHGSFDVTLTVTDANSLTDEKTLTLFINDRCGNGGYIITPDTSPNYTWAYGTGGLPTLTVSSGITGFRTFSVSITPFGGHGGSEALLFVHMRDGVMLSIAANFADYDTISTGKAAFNVKPGDIIMVYIVDDLGSDATQNPNIL